MKLPIMLNGLVWVEFGSSDSDPYMRLVWGITGARDCSSEDVAFVLYTEPESSLRADQLRTIAHGDSGFSVTRDPGRSGLLDCTYVSGDKRESFEKLVAVPTPRTSGPRSLYDLHDQSRIGLPDEIARPPGR